MRLSFPFDQSKSISNVMIQVHYDENRSSASRTRGTEGADAVPIGWRQTNRMSNKWICGYQTKVTRILILMFVVLPELSLYHVS